MKTREHKLDANRMFFLARRSDRLFGVMKELDDLIEMMDDTGRLESARLLINSFWEDEYNQVQSFETRINEALENEPK